MATVAAIPLDSEPRRDMLSGTPRAHSVDRWIYVAMAAWFILIVLVGFIPDSFERMAAIETGRRPPFPMMAHVHAVLMGTFMLLLLAQTSLVATGRCEYHRRLGLVSILLVPALVVAGCMLATINYNGVLNGSQFGPLAARAGLSARLPIIENILLMQLRIGILFSLLLAIGLAARGRDAGLHKRMMILGTGVALPPAIDRMHWLPATLPDSPLSPDLYVLLVLSPMFIWDLARNRSVHRAYWLFLAIYLAAAVVVHGLWDTPWWHATARGILAG